MRRRMASLLLALGTLAALVAVAGPADAQGHPMVTVRPGEPVTRSYPPIPGNFPAAPTLNPWPVECEFEFEHACDNIPITVVPPEGLGPADAFFLQLEIGWDDPQHLGDLDIYLWDEKQIEAEAGDSSPSYTEMNRSAGSGNPEIIKQLVGSITRMNLVVVNWAGPNLGYTLKASISVVKFDAPFESLAPDFKPTQSNDDSDAAVAPFDFSSPPPASGGQAPIPPTFGEIAVQPDSDLDFGPSDFDGALAAPPPLTGVASSTLRPPRDVPGAVAAFWLGVVPALLVAAAGLLLARRRRDAFATA